jgi:hypothetical protein
MTLGVIEAIPKMDCERDGIDQVPEMTPAYDVQVNNEAEALLPGLQPTRKESISTITRFLEAGVGLSPEQRFEFRAGALGSALVFYPTNPYTAEAFSKFGQRRDNVVRGLFELVYSSPDD